MKFLGSKLMVVLLILNMKYIIVLIMNIKCLDLFFLKKQMT